MCQLNLFQKNSIVNQWKVFQHIYETSHGADPYHVLKSPEHPL